MIYINLKTRFKTQMGFFMSRRVRNVAVGKKFTALTVQHGVYVVKLELHTSTTNEGFVSGEFNTSLLYLKHLQYLDLSSILFIQSSDHDSNFTQPNFILELISEFREMRYLNVSHISCESRESI